MFKQYVSMNAETLSSQVVDPIKSVLLPVALCRVTPHAYSNIKEEININSTAAEMTLIASSFIYLFIVLFSGARKQPMGLHKGAPTDMHKQCSIRSRHIKHMHNIKS